MRWYRTCSHTMCTNHPTLTSQYQYCKHHEEDDETLDEPGEPVLLMHSPKRDTLHENMRSTNAHLPRMFPVGGTNAGNQQWYRDDIYPESSCGTLSSFSSSPDTNSRVAVPYHRTPTTVDQRPNYTKRVFGFNGRCDYDGHVNTYRYEDDPMTPLQSMQPRQSLSLRTDDQLSTSCMNDDEDTCHTAQETVSDAETPEQDMDGNDIADQSGTAVTSNQRAQSDTSGDVTASNSGTPSTSYDTKDGYSDEDQQLDVCTNDVVVSAGGDGIPVSTRVTFDNGATDALVPLSVNVRMASMASGDVSSGASSPVVTTTSDEELVHDTVSLVAGATLDEDLVPGTVSLVTNTTSDEDLVSSDISSVISETTASEISSVVSATMVSEVSSVASETSSTTSETVSERAPAINEVPSVTDLSSVDDGSGDESGVVQNKTSEHVDDIVATRVSPLSHVECVESAEFQDMFQNDEHVDQSAPARSRHALSSGTSGTSNNPLPVTYCVHVHWDDVRVFVEWLRSLQTESLPPLSLCLYAPRTVTANIHTQAIIEAMCYWSIPHTVVDIVFCSAGGERTIS